MVNQFPKFRLYRIIASIKDEYFSITEHFKMYSIQSKLITSLMMLSKNNTQNYLIVYLLFFFSEKDDVCLQVKLQNICSFLRVHVHTSTCVCMCVVHVYGMYMCMF